ncbi:MAG TPA: Ig-like domain-containing protein, partial [Candidatus Saccharimonadales bacterium]|nr:Ig-like domain-containing protein [Candidatus Saccharimonadales bacterium]
VLHIFYANNAQALFCPVSHSDTTSCDTSSLGEGVYYVKAGATDNAGNNKTVVQYFTIDKTKPVAGTTKITSPTNGQLFSTGSFGVSGTANDSLSGIDPNKVYITINKISGLGGSFVASTAFNNEQAVYDTATHSFSYNGVSGLSDGFYRIQLKAYDKAGNIRFDHLDVQVDSTAPTVNITAPGDNDTLSFALDGVFTIRGGVNDVNPDHYYLHISGPGGYTSGPGTVNDSTSFTDQPLFNWDLSGLASGTYTIDLEARDAAGNKDAGSVQTISVTIDNTAPTLTINPSSGTDTTPTITGTTSEATDTVTVDGNTASVSATANGSGTYNWSYTPAAPFLIGSHTITVVSTDQNGNATTQTATVTVTSPVITLIGGAGGGGTTTVTVTPTTGGTDNTDGQVLGASTNNPSDSGQVKAAETSNGNGDNTVKDNFQSSNFLGLGWWWLLVLAAILGGWWFLAGRRDND